MKGEIVYKSGTILTDGKSLIYLDHCREASWTPENNYGSKWAEYSNCRTFPDNLCVDKVRVVNNYKNIPSLWFQPTYHLNAFKPIKRKLLNQDVLKYLIANENNKK